EGEKIKEAELLIDPLDLPCDILSELKKAQEKDKIGSKPDKNEKRGEAEKS
nr:hypothetical protein [Tanacetum cinerariifolium]